MAKLFVFVCLLLIYVSRVGATANTLANGSALETVEPDAMVSGLLPGTKWMQGLYDHHAWKIEYLQNASHVCREHIAEYLQELKREISWAAKMNDASGRYNGQYFFGNDFWLGSSTLCWELSNPDTNLVVPPFRVHFNVAKIELTINDQTSPNSRQLMVGQCMPASCNPKDLKSVLEFDSFRATLTANTSALKVLDVRPVPGDYELLKDIKFYIVGGFAVVIATVVVIATLYESCLNSQVRKITDEESQSHSANNNNDSKSGEITSPPASTNGIHNQASKLKQKTNIGKGLASRLLLCFSALSNGKKILEVDNLPRDSIKCVHGLRFLSVTWVIMVHTYLEIFSVAENKNNRVLIERYFIYQTISNATFSVDSFFFISGLLVTILYFRTARQKQEVPENRKSVFLTVSASLKRFLLLICYRLMRLTPAYLFVLGVHEVALRYLHNTSVFEPNFYDHITCDKYWWRNALYINTWYPQKEMCMLWSWYMSNDTQFYVVAVVILLIAVRSDRHLKVAAGIVIVFLVSSWLTTFIIAMRFNYHARIEEPFALFDQLYDKPWMRIGPYLVGMVTGWYLYSVECRVSMSRIAVALGWLVSIACLLSLVYGVGKDGITVPLSAIYAALGHTAWGLSLAWITLACCTGHGGWVNSFLTFRGFLPFSRLTYCAYLIHPMIMCITSFSMDGPILLHNGLVLVMYFGNVIVSFILSFFVSLAFEAPIVRLLKVIMGGRSKDE